MSGGLAVEEGKTRLSRSHTVSSFLRSSIRKKFGYDKLPPQIINVHIKKLDGSSFELEIMKNARVAELKKAVERFFWDLPDDSWSYVWGYFAYPTEAKSFFMMGYIYDFMESRTLISFNLYGDMRIQPAEDE